MSLYKQVQAGVIPEYQKTLFDWGGTRKGKQFTVTAPRVTTVKVRITRNHPPPPPQMSAPSVRALTPPELPSISGKSSAPVSTASASSSLTSLSSANTEAALDALPRKKRKLSSASSSSQPSSSMARDATPLTPLKTAVNDVNDASSSSSSSLKRVRSTENASSSPESWEKHETEDAALLPLPPKRMRKLKDASMRETTPSPSVSADTSRASSPPPPEKLSVSKKSTSRAVIGSNKQVKRRKRRALTNLALPPKRGSYRALEPVFVRDTSTPCSVSACESETYYTPSKLRQTWTEEDGCVGDQLRTSEQVVGRLAGMGRYITLFRNPSNPDDKTFELSEFPTVQLEYPNSGAKESFMLARPKDRDHYDPTYDIEDTLRAFIKHIVPPEYKDLFGPLPEDALQNMVDSDGDDENRSSSVSPEIPLARHRRTYAHSLRTPVASSPAASESEYGTPPPLTSRCSPSPKGLMKALVSARHRKDGPTYRATLEEINKCIRELKEHNSDGNLLRAVPRTWSMTGIPRGVVFRIIEETYQRCVGPRISQLRKYEAFSSNVYGELTPAFVNDIIEKTKLNPDHLFLDLGSGVGNVVLQTSLQTGCKAFGIEEREDMARIADDQLEQIKLRCRMWGVSNGEAELVQGDMTTSSRVDELMSKADVVLVNNYVFSEELNTALRPKFLDLKEGAYVVSLKPFAPPRTQMLTERNFDDISAIFDVSAHPYHSGTVSWSSGSGTYYIHHVNREGYRKSREALLRRMERRRSTRR